MSETLPAPSSTWALFLDVDGALLDIAATPYESVLPGDLNTALASVSCSLEGAVALVSGRSIADLDRLFTPLRLPAAGQHGAELRLVAGGDVMRHPRSARLQTIRDRLEAFAASRPGILIEDKGRCIAAHFRNAARHRAALRRAAREAVFGCHDVELIPARMAFEIRPRGVDKRLAVEWLMRTSPFRHRCPIFIGDDSTDEDAFAAANAFGGHAIRVGRRGKSRARWRIAVPADVRRWLGEIAAILSDREGCGRRRA